MLSSILLCLIKPTDLISCLRMRLLLTTYSRTAASHFASTASHASRRCRDPDSPPPLSLSVLILALLSGTLRTFQVASCDGDQLHLSCPPNTVVVIKLVHYGRLASKPGLCGHPSDMQRFNNSDCMDRSALKVRRRGRRRDASNGRAVTVCTKEGLFVMHLCIPEIFSIFWRLKCQM